MNKNAIKTTLMFLGIIFFVLMGRLFFNEHELLVTTNANQIANTSCTQDKEFC